MKFVASTLTLSLSLFTSVSFGNTNGLYHQFTTSELCRSSQQIFMNDGVRESNYSNFISSLVGKLEAGNDPCAMSMILNLQSFIRHLIKTDNPSQYNLFFEDLNGAYLLAVQNEQRVQNVCRLHSNPNEEKVNSCTSDHVVDLAVLSNRSWYEYFSNNIQAQSNLQELWNESLVGAAGAGVVSVLFRSQIKRYGIKVIKQISRRLKAVFSRGGGASVARSGSLGVGGGVFNEVSSQETELSLRQKLESFKEPLGFIAFTDGDDFVDDFDILYDPYRTVRDIGGIVFSGILPIMLVESNAYRLAYLIPHIGAGLGARAAVHARKFLKQPIGRILAAVVATATVGNFLVDEWNMNDLKNLLADLHGKIAAIEEALQGADPQALSTYLLTQELVNFTQTLSLIYASPVVAELERKYHLYSTAAICRPINAVYHRVPLEEMVDFYIPENMDNVMQGAQDLFDQKNPTSCFSSVQRLFDRSEEFIPGVCHNLYEGQAPMELSITTLVKTLNTINTNVGISEYQGLKMKIYDIIDYLIRFKSPEEYTRKLESAIQTNLNESREYAPPLMTFAESFLNASAPYQLEVSIQTWNEYLRSIKYYRAKQKAAEFTGYEYGCSYGEFGALFNDFDFLYSKRIPCESDYASEYDQCIQCGDRKDYTTCQVIEK